MNVFYDNTLVGAPKTVFGVIQSDPKFTTLSRLIQVGGLTDAINQQVPKTVFAPTNEAFNMLPQSLTARLSSLAGRDDLRALILYHVLPMKVNTNQISQSGQTLTPSTFGSNKNLCIHIDDNRRVRVNDAVIIQPDINATDGVVHTIDRALNPLNGGFDCIAATGNSTTIIYSQPQTQPNSFAQKRVDIQPQPQQPQPQPPRNTCYDCQKGNPALNDESASDGNYVKVGRRLQFGNVDTFYF